MDANTNTLKDIKLHKEIIEIIGSYFPESFVNTVFNHMKSNTEDLFNHEYLCNALTVAHRIVQHEAGFTEHDKKLLYAIVALSESGHPLTRLYPYDASPGVAWMFLRLYAHGVFNQEELRFITQSCKPLMPQTMRPSLYTHIQLVAHNTQRLTDVVNQNYKKLYHEFIERHNRDSPYKEMDELFMAHYGPAGNLWGAVSESAKILFHSEISLFKREIRKVLGHYS